MPFFEKNPQKKVKGVQCSKFDTNILGVTLKTVRSLGTIAFELRELFKSLRVKNKGRVNFFFGVFFFCEIGVASTYHAEPKPFYYRKVEYWGFLRPFSKVKNVP